MCTVLLPPGDNPIVVNKYIISKRNLHITEPQDTGFLFPRLRQVPFHSETPYLANMSATVSSQTLPALSQTSQFCIPF